MKNNHSRAIPLRARITEDTSFKIIGLGGVGGIVARYLAVFLAAMDRRLRLVLVDGDTFEPDNRTRMLFNGCGNKAGLIRDELLPYFQNSSLTIQAIGEYVTPANLDQLIQPGDIVILAVDNHATRKQVSDFCASNRPDVALFSGGNDGVSPEATGTRDRGTFGNVQVFLRKDGEDRTPPLTHLHPEIENPADRNPGEAGCGEQFASTPQILFANLATASAILNALWLHLCDESLHYSEAVFDIGEAVMRPVAAVEK